MGPWRLVHRHCRENGMLLFALISGFAFGVYDSLGLELVMDSLPDPRRAGHDLGIYALANSAVWRSPPSSARYW